MSNARAWTRDGSAVADQAPTLALDFVANGDALNLLVRPKI